MSKVLLSQLAIPQEVFFMEDNKVKNVFVSRIKVDQQLSPQALEVIEHVTVFASESFHNPQHNILLVEGMVYTSREELLKSI